MIQFEEISDEQRAMVDAVGRFLSGLRNRPAAAESADAPGKSPAELLQEVMSGELAPHLGLLLSTSGPLVAGSTRRQYRERLGQLAAMAGAEPDQVEQSLKQRNAPHGHWEEVAATLAEYEESGISRFYIQVLGDATPAAVEADLEALESVSPHS